MKILKKYVRNQIQPKGCIIECYIYEEAVEFCKEYFSNVKIIRLPKPIQRTDDNGTSALYVVPISNDLLCQAQRYVLNNTEEV